MAEVKTRMGRIFFQTEELYDYDLTQCTGLTGWNKPRGAITAIRQQSRTRAQAEDMTGYVRASADMAAFTIQARLLEVGNFLINLDCESNVQCLMIDCGDPEDYYGFRMGIGWVRCPPGDLAGAEPLAIISGDNTPITLNNPFSAIYGPYLIDFKVKFLSRRSIAETGGIKDLVYFQEECLEDCLFKAGKGQYGYAVAESQPGSPVDKSAVWFTEDYSDNWSQASTQPFLGGEGISCVVVKGTVLNHRIIVSRGTTDAANPAEVAIADCTVIGQTSWSYANVGAVNGEYINYMAWPNARNLFAVTNLGRIYKSQDSGLTWDVVYLNASGFALREVSFTRGGIGWVVGNSNVILITDDYGETWTVVVGPVGGVVNYTTCNVSTDRKLFIGCSNGNVYATVNEGIDWLTRPMQGIIATNIVRVRSYDTHWIWVIADIANTPPLSGASRVLRSTNGGATFRQWDLAQNLAPNNGLNALAVIDVNRVVVAGNPYLGTAFLTKTQTTIDSLIS
jgi:hypothetical protein